MNRSTFTRSAERRAALAWWDALSFKSQAMIVVGVAWAFIGLGVALEANTVVPGAPHTAIPRDLRATVWCATGAWAVYAGATRHHKNLALGALMIMPAVRTISYTYAWIMALVPGGDDGVPSGWYQAVFQALLMILVWGIARLGRQAPK